MSAIDCRVVETGIGRKEVDLLISVSGFQYILSVGLLGEIPTIEAENRNILLVPGPVSEEVDGWCQIIRGLPFEDVIKHVIPQS